jgi:hypothetical protein
MTEERILAVGLLTQRDLDVLGAGFSRLWPVDETPCFSLLIEAIDEADRQLWRARDQEERLQIVPPSK